jgi:hypothetical protein
MAINRPVAGKAIDHDAAFDARRGRVPERPSTGRKQRTGCRASLTQWQPRRFALQGGTVVKRPACERNVIIARHAKRPPKRLQSQTNVQPHVHR